MSVVSCRYYESQYCSEGGAQSVARGGGPLPGGPCLLCVGEFDLPGDFFVTDRLH